jgi:hypothetical protein
MKATDRKAMVVSRLALVLLTAGVYVVIAGAAFDAPTVSIDGPATITIEPGALRQVHLTTTVSGAVSAQWSKAPFTVVPLAYLQASVSAFTKLFAPWSSAVDMLPTGPGPVEFSTPNAFETDVTFDVATHAYVPSSGSFVARVEPGRSQPLAYALGNDNSEGAYLITVTVRNAAGVTASDSVIVSVRTNANPSTLGVRGDSVPPGDANDFLRAGGVDNAGVAAAYYKTIDPNDLRLTQAAWEEVNGYNDPRNTAVEANGYFNQGDLGFGRSISMVVDQRPGYAGNIAFTTVNHLSAADGLAETNKVSTVNMEYSPMVAGGPRIVKFYVYADKGDASGFPDGIAERQLSSNFEGRGEKFLPALCFACHGGSDRASSLAPGTPYPNGGNANSYFLAFDMSTMEFTNEQPRANLEATFKAMNRAVLQTRPKGATRTVINGLYGGSTLPSATQNTNWVPSDWSAAGESRLYLDVIVPACRSCHTSSETELLKFSSFRSLARDVREKVFGERTMPNALPSYNSFWLSTNPYQPGVLSDALTRFGAPPR